MAGFEEVYQQHAKAVYRFLLSLTKDKEEAEVLLQETFYQAFLHIDRFEGRCSLYTWLCQIGKNAWYKECRRKKRFVIKDRLEQLVSPTEIDEIVPDKLQTQPETQYLKKEELMRIRQAILKLEESYRDVFILHAYGGVKLKEIAASYGKSERWARVTYYRAKQQIAKEVSQ